MALPASCQYLRNRSRVVFRDARASVSVNTWYVKSEFHIATGAVGSTRHDTNSGRGNVVISSQYFLPIRRSMKNKQTKKQPASCRTTIKRESITYDNCRSITRRSPRWYSVFSLAWCYYLCWASSSNSIVVTFCKTNQEKSTAESA